MYLTLKNLHMGLAYLSVGGFALRGIWMLLESPWLDKKVVRILPHVIDTLLLLAAVGLVVILEQYPFVHSWLTAKIFGLVAYVVLGTVALKRGPTRAIRAVAFVLALLTFAWMVSVARSKDPLGFLGWLF